MDAFSPAELRKWYVISLITLVITAWFSVGFYHPDEHFQILEFCNYKLGFSPASALPWEFGAHCRPALQPFIAYIISKATLAAGVYNPVYIAFIIRLLMGLFTWLTARALIRVLLPGFKSVRGAKFFVLSSLFLWFVPYIGVRYSSENIAANCFLLAIAIILELKNGSIGKQNKRLLIAGLLLGFSLFLRLQMGFAFIGLGCWLLLHKSPLRYYMLLSLAAMVAIGISTCVDYWFYGQWVFTPYNYFNVNIIQHVAAKFGTDPWWYYFQLFINMAIPPLSIVLLALLFIGCAKKQKNIFNLVLIGFLIGHFAIGHKEMRFLFPMSFPFIYLFCSGLDIVFVQHNGKPWLNWSIKLLVTLNIAVLIFKIFTPAEEVIKYYSYIYNYVTITQHGRCILAAHKKSTYTMGPIEANFYKPRPLNMQVFQNAAGLQQILANNNGAPVIYLSHTLDPGPELAGCRAEKIYCQFPEWVLKYNINQWQDRSYIWAVFRLYPKS